MSARSRLVAFASVAGLALAGLASPAVLAAPSQAASLVRVAVTGIDRLGHKVGVYATIYTTNEPPIVVPPGTSVLAPTGPAWISAEVDTFVGPPNNQVEQSATLVARRVSLSRRGTITLDARPGKLMTVDAPVQHAAQTTQIAQACIGGNFVGGAPVEVLSFPGVALYVVPVKASGFFFGYGASWQTSAASYFFAGQSYGGLPSRLHYQAKLSGMAKIRFVFKTGTAIGGYNSMLLQTTNACQVSDGSGAGGTFTDYVTAGGWLAETYGYRSFWQTTSRYKAGQSYVDSFGDAAWGPGQDFPNVQYLQLVLFPMDPISDPMQDSSTCCDVSSITLSRGGHVLKHEVLSEWRAVRAFTVNLPGVAWYTMQENSTRRVPGLATPADILSPKVSIVWRFRAGPGPSAGNGIFVPVTATHFLPRGLNLQNQAAADGTTVVEVHVVEPSAPGFNSPPRHRLNRVLVQMSVNDGKTWQTLRLVPHGAYWLVTVHDPSGGYVSLRSKVTDVVGDSTVETIYRAYAIG